MKLEESVRTNGVYEVKHKYFYIKFNVARNVYKYVTIDVIDSYIDDSRECKEWFLGKTYLKYLKLFADRYNRSYEELLDNIEFVLRRSAETDDRKKIRYYPKFKKPIEVEIHNIMVRLSSIYPRFLVGANGNVYEMTTGERKDYKVHIDTTKNIDKSAKRVIVYRPYYDMEVEVYNFSRRDKRRIYKSVYVAWEYLPNDDYVTYNMVDHMDENTLNDRVDNLQWATNSINIARSNIQSGNIGKYTDNCRYVLVNLTDSEIECGHSLASIAISLDLCPHSLNNYKLPRIFLHRKDKKAYVVFSKKQLPVELDKEQILNLADIEMLKKFNIRFTLKNNKRYYFSDLYLLTQFIQNAKALGQLEDIHFHNSTMLYTAINSHISKDKELSKKYLKYGNKRFEMWRAYLKDLGYDLYRGEKTLSKNYNGYKGMNLKNNTIILQRSIEWWANFLGVSTSQIADRAKGQIRYRVPIGDWLIIPSYENF